MDTKDGDEEIFVAKHSDGTDEMSLTKDNAIDISQQWFCDGKKIPSI